jgi:glycosyltransferase involved in cell wall biosynthesis
VRVLYLGYWGLDDGLTKATVLPHVRELAGSQRVSSLLLVTVERKARTASGGLDIAGVQHNALEASNLRPNLAARSADFLRFPLQLARLCEAHRIDLLLARGAPAGALAHLVQAHRGVEYAVESYEPHADYMLDGGVWAPWDPRHLFQRRWEQRLEQQARWLLPVSENFRAVLISRGVPGDRIHVCPCTVDETQFAFSADDRQRTRAQLGLGETVPVGIYVGQFGGTYLDVDAFIIFRAFAEADPRFSLVVLTPDEAVTVADIARRAEFPKARLRVLNVAHAEVPRYLSAADVGFATIRPAPSRRFCSPVKVGEYWANGLPVVITPGVGDDSAIIERERAGAIVDLRPASSIDAIKTLASIRAEVGYRSRIATLASKYRSRERLREAYRAMGLL